MYVFISINSKHTYHMTTYIQLSILLTQNPMKSISIWMATNSIIYMQQFCETSVFGQQMDLNQNHLCWSVHQRTQYQWHNGGVLNFIRENCYIWKWMSGTKCSFISADGNKSPGSKMETVGKTKSLKQNEVVGKHNLEMSTDWGTE